MYTFLLRLLPFCNFQDACIRPACRLTEKLVNGQCLPVVTGHSGFCFDFRLTAVFNTPGVGYDNSGSDDLILDILAHVNLFPSRTYLHVYSGKRQIRTVHVTKAGMLKLDIVAVVQVEDLITMQAAYDAVTTGLQEYNGNATWDNASFTVALTPTRFKPISREVTAMVAFHDVDTSATTCHVVYAMDHIQACDGVTSDTFTKLDGYHVMVIIVYCILIKPLSTEYIYLLQTTVQYNILCI